MDVEEWNLGIVGHAFTVKLGRGMGYPKIVKFQLDDSYTSCVCFQIPLTGLCLGLSYTM